LAPCRHRLAHGLRLVRGKCRDPTLDLGRDAVVLLPADAAVAGLKLGVLDVLGQAFCRGEVVVEAEAFG
jgi:hypothetical protein